MSEKNNRKRKFALIPVLVVLMLVVAIGTVSAKYIFSSSSEGIFRTKEFYFTSDILKEEDINYRINYDAQYITFEISNGLDEDRYATDNIVYTISVTDANGNRTAAVVENLNTRETGVSGGTIFSQNGYQTIKFKISGIGTGDGESYSVKDTYKVHVNAKMGENLASSIFGYSKDMYATFTPTTRAENVAYKSIKTTKEYLELNVWTEYVNAPEKISVEYGDMSASSVLLPDNTDPAMRDVKVNTARTTQKIYFEDTMNFDESYAFHTYRFFVAPGRTETVNVDNFTVILYSGDGTTIATPRN